MQTKIFTSLWLLLFLSVVSFSQPVQVTKSYGKPVFMHYMPWFDTPQYGGGWGYHWTMANKNPDVIVDGSTGKRQIASHYYPMIGPYDCQDPDVIEYHLLLMKYAGIDGVLVDWYGSQGTNGDVGSLLTNSNALIDQTDEAGMKFALILEDRFSGSISQVQGNIAYARDNYFNRNNYYRHGAGNDPLVGVFGPITFQNPGDWTTILSAANEDVEFLPLWYEAGDGGSNSDGEYVWIYEENDDYYSRMQAYYQNRAGSMKTVMGVAYPGFHDFYAEGGAGSSYFHIPHNGTGTLSQTLGLVNQYGYNIDILQLATWNDFGEGTIFEPTFEFGFSFLTTLQQFLGVSYGEYELQQIYRLYNLRKQHAGNGSIQSQLNQAYDHFVALRVNDAVSVLNAVDEGTPPPPSCNVVNIPGTLQAEGYCGMSGIQLENTTDAGGGQNVGWIDAGDWLTYQVSVPTSGSYVVNYRVASGNGGGGIRLERAGGGQTFGTIGVPSTGGWQNWTTISHTVQLTAGQQDIAIVATSGGYNINWISLAADGGGGGPNPVWGTVQAEAWSAMNGVLTETTSDTGGGENVGWIDAGDWMEYLVQVPTTGSYNIEYRVASAPGGGSVSLAQNGANLSTTNIPNTGGWQTWTTVSTTVSLTAGVQTIRLTAASGGWNINWWSVSSVGGGGNPTGAVYKIRNVWQNTYLADGGDRVTYSTSASGAAYEWELVDTGGNKELKNVATGEYMHVQNITGYVQCTAITPGWGSAQWVIEDAGNGESRIKNVWQSNDYIHVENLQGHAQYGTIYPAWASAKWVLEPVSGARVLSEFFIEQNEIKTVLDIYPNPVTDKLTIDFSGSIDTETVWALYDLSGSLIMKRRMTAPRMEILRGDLKSGVYMLRISTENGVLSSKVIIQ